MVNCYGKLEGNPVVAQTSVVLDQADIYTSVIVPAEQNDVELTRIQVFVILINSLIWDAAIFTTGRFTVDVLLAKSCCLLTFIHPKKIVSDCCYFAK